MGYSYKYSEYVHVVVIHVSRNSDAH